jgi:hypothetical protein
VLDQAREYLPRVVPWPQDGETFLLNLHWTVDAPERDKPIWTGRAVRSVEEAIKTLKWALSLPNVRDIYFCQSAQSTATEKVSAKGHKYLLPIRNQSTAVALKSIFLDIDVKGDGYDTLEAGVIALEKFRADSKMPRPTMIVKSGGGLHVYWVMMRALTVSEWTPLSRALASAVKQLGLKADTGCTIDAARILRVPDTYNCKNGQRRPVNFLGKRLDFDYSVEALEAVLEPFIEPSDHHTSLFPALKPLDGVSDLAAGIEIAKAPPITLEQVAEECPFIKDTLDTAGADNANPLWNITTLIASFTEGEREDAHRMSEGHPGYTDESTNELFDRKMREREGKNLGWPSCKTIQLAGCSQCAACPRKDAGKSPLHVTRKVTLPTGIEKANDLPPGYARNKDNLVCRVGADEQGNAILLPVMDYQIRDAWLQCDPWILNFTARTHAGSERQVTLPLLATSTRDGVPKALSAQGIVLQEFSHKMAREFFVSWITTLQKSKQTVVSSAPFGWSMKGGKIEGFVYGGEVWMPTGSRPSANADPVMARQYRPSGEIAHWITAGKLITDQNRPALDAIVASSFGAPLVKFTSQTGLLMSCYSLESGIGKTTALKVAQSVWGDPVRGMQGLTDTQLSVIRKMSELQALPLYWDELKTEEDTKKFVNLTFQLSSGKEKSRLTQNIEQRDLGTWQTMLVSASNESLIDFITGSTKMTTAGLYRVFEYEVTPGVGGQIRPTDAQRILGKLHDNYGLVGLEYAKWLGQNFEAIDAEIEGFERDLADEVEAKQDERFWTALVTCILMGARYSNRLGFTAIDEVELRKFMLAQLENMRDERNKQPVDMRNVMNVSNVLTQYLNAMWTRHTLWTNRIHISPGKPPKGSIRVQKPTDKLDGIYVHVGMEDMLVRISKTQFGKWLKDTGYSNHIFLRALDAEMGSKTVHGRLGSGTEFALGTEYLLEIDLVGTAVANFLEEA